VCGELDHQHREFGFHVHRSAVALPDGTEVTAVSFDPTQPYERQDPPDFGLYFDPLWQPPWVYQQLAWPDFGVPGDPGLVRRVLRALLDRARTGQRVEIGCLEGHGRTGTALACLVGLTGQSADEAVTWVRVTYCEQAIETDEQEEFVARVLAER